MPKVTSIHLYPVFFSFLFFSTSTLKQSFVFFWSHYHQDPGVSFHGDGTFSYTNKNKNKKKKSQCLYTRPKITFACYCFCSCYFCLFRLFVFFILNHRYNFLIILVYLGIFFRLITEPRFELKILMTSHHSFKLRNLDSKILFSTC